MMAAIVLEWEGGDEVEPSAWVIRKEDAPNDEGSEWTRNTDLRWWRTRAARKWAAGVLADAGIRPRWRSKGGLRFEAKR